MKPSDITRYQNWARSGYVDPLRCPDRFHPPLLADTDFDVAVKCIICTYRREIGLAEQKDIMRKIAEAEKVYLQEKLGKIT